ncbi:MAG: TlpA family protein disulfide reductase, partial [Candidatus Latescibacterota bacterium]|nr:TlpA family protein disulfide reductase [Candidatus Latescibacterota bacterium]
VLHADKAVQSAYGVEGIPVVYLVDRQGRVRWHRVGFSSGGEEDIAREIEKLLDEPSEPPTSSG